jgi:hypothetical protein
MSDAPQFEADQFEALVRDTLGRHGLRAADQYAWDQAEYSGRDADSMMSGLIRYAPDVQARGCLLTLVASPSLTHPNGATWLFAEAERGE